MRRELVPISKFLSKVLRHRPEILGLELDAAGWASIDALLAAMEERRRPLAREVLDEIVATNDKQRFAVSDDGRRIRANQGHSRPVDLGLVPVAPPAELFHGTARDLVEHIREVGLRRMNRHHVHLSSDVETARRVGGRGGPPAVLRVRAAEMHAAGHTFFRSENGVWLTERVPAEFLEEATSRSES